jgi:peptide/nickel transport system substrate-binding protein
LKSELQNKIKEDNFMKQGRMHYFFVVLFILGMMFGIAPMAFSAQAIKDNVIVVLKGEPSNVDPHGNTELVAFTTQTQIFDTLLKKNEKGEIIPWLAKKWEIIDNKTVRFFIRDDVTFHNGEKLTAEDVRFSIERATKMPSSAAVFKSFDGEKTATVDDYTVDIVTKGPFAGIFNYLCSTRGGIVSKKAVQSMGDAEFGRSPIGSGPFKFDNWRTGTDITLVRNDAFWGNKPKYGTITLKFITETANRAIEIESGGADIAFDIDPADVARLSENEDLSVVTGPSYGLSYIVFSMSDPILGHNKKLREALSLALDKNSIVDVVYGNLGKPSTSVIPGTVFSHKSQGNHEYNVEKATALLKEIGYEDGLAVDLCAPNTKEFTDIAEIVQNMWSKIKVTANIKTSAMAEFLAAGRRGENQIGICGANYTTGDPGHALADFDTRSDGFFRPDDKKIDEYLDKGASIYDETERAAVYQEAQSYIYGQYYMIPIADRMVTYVTTQKVENFYCDPGNCPYLAEIVVYE